MERNPLRTAAWRKLRATRLKAYQEEHDSTCRLCLQEVDFGLKSPAPGSPEIDHMIPVKRSGHPYEWANLQLAHKLCNQRKGNKTMAEWWKHVGAVRTPDTQRPTAGEDISVDNTDDYDWGA